MSKAITHAEDPLKGIDIEDKSLKVVYLKSGTYLIDDEVVSVKYGEGKVQVNDVLNIRRITDNEYIKEYVCGDEKLSVQQYDEQKEKLLSKGNMTVMKKSGRVLRMSLHIENSYNPGYRLRIQSRKSANLY